MSISDEAADRQRKILELIRQGVDPHDIRLFKGEPRADKDVHAKAKRKYTSTGNKRGNPTGKRYVHYTPPGGHTLVGKYIGVACGKIIVVKHLRTQDKAFVTCEECKVTFLPKSE